MEIYKFLCINNLTNYLPSTLIIFNDELEYLVIKSFIFCSIIDAHKSLEKPNTPFPSDEKATVKRLSWFAISNACIFHFSDLLDFSHCYCDAIGGLKQYRLKYS